MKNKIYSLLGKHQCTFLLLLLILYSNQVTQATITAGTHNWNLNSELKYIASFNGVFDRPLLILEGFDILDSYTESDLMDNWNTAP